MSHTLTIELSDEVYDAIHRRAQGAGTSAARWVAEALQRRYAPGIHHESREGRQAARQRFERHFGEVDLGHPTGADNRSIDADLARVYAISGEST